jgi:hypothetical protein
LQSQRIEWNLDLLNKLECEGIFGIKTAKYKFSN